VERNSLKGFVKNLCEYFERKPISQETFDQWFAEIKHLPEEPLPWIAGKIKVMESFPRNLPIAIKHYWHEWLAANPEKFERDKPLGCSDCNQGYIQVSYFDRSLGRYYNTMFRCAHCKPEFPRAMALATAFELLERGFCKPLGYLTSWKYGDIFPEPNQRPEELPVHEDYKLRGDGGDI
jgi:hypothetical protein